MMVQVPYSRLRGLDYPLVPVTLDDRITTLALVDSGASFSVFKVDVARELGIDVDRGRKLNIGSICGGIPIYMHEIRVEVATHRFKCKIGFSEGHLASINILGRDNFFKQFLVTFDDRARTLMLSREGPMRKSHNVKWKRVGKASEFANRRGSVKKQ